MNRSGLRQRGLTLVELVVVEVQVQQWLEMLVQDMVLVVVEVEQDLINQVLAQEAHRV